MQINNFTPVDESVIVMLTVSFLISQLEKEATNHPNLTNWAQPILTSIPQSQAHVLTNAALKEQHSLSDIQKLTEQKTKPDALESTARAFLPCWE